MGSADAVLWRQCLTDYKDYPKAIDLALADDRKTHYESLWTALDMKAKGNSARKIEQETKISPQLLHYYMKQTAAKDQNGERLGFRALLIGNSEKWKIRQVSSAVLNSLKPLPNQLTAFFVAYPGIFQKMVDAATKGRLPDSDKDGPELSFAILHTTFLALAEEVGLKAPHFPFTAVKAKPGLRKWVRKIRRKTEAELRKAAARHRATNPWAGLAPVTRCYEEVQIDGHWADVEWTIEAPALNGEGTIRTRVTRIWIIAVVETRSTALLGFSIAFGPSYSGADVARAIRNALVPWQPRKLSTTKLAYKEGDCYPTAHPELAYVCWDRLMLDRAKGHLANYFLSTLERGVNCVPVFGPIGTPDARGLIEGLFQLLEEAGFRNARGRLGSSPTDPKKDARVPDEFLMDYSLLLDFAEVLGARYNGCSPPGSTLSRVEILRQNVAREQQIFRRLPNDLRASYLDYDMFDEAVIGRDKRQMVVRWKDARYHGEALELHPEFVDEPVIVQAASMDLRKIRVSLQRDGTPLGILEVEPRWRKTAHSLTTRRQATKMRKENSFIAMAADIPLAMRAELEERIKKAGRFARAQYARLLVEQGAVVGEGSQANPSKPPVALQPDAPVRRTDPIKLKGHKDADTPLQCEGDELSRWRKRIAELGSSYSNH